LLRAVYSVRSRFDFWNGYHRARSIVDAIVSTEAGFVAIAIVLYVVKRRRIEGKSHCR